MWVQIAITFILCWWVILFMMLPIGVRSQLEEGEIVHGTEEGAPKDHMMRKKVFWTSCLAGGLTVIIQTTIFIFSN